MILMVTILMVFLRVVEPARASGTAAGPGSSFPSFSFRRVRRRSAAVRGGDVLVGGGVGGGKKEDKNQAILDKLDVLIDAVKAGGIINMDGQKVGEVIGLATGGGTD